MCLLIYYFVFKKLIRRFFFFFFFAMASFIPGTYNLIFDNVLCSFSCFVDKNHSKGGEEGGRESPEPADTFFFFNSFFPVFLQKKRKLN